jgi:lathosterol oxidase
MELLSETPLAAWSTMMGLAGVRLWAFLVTISALGGLALYFGFGSILYGLYYVRRREDPESWKIQAKRFPSAKLHRWAISVAAGNLLLGGLISGTFIYYILHGGRTALYMDVGEYGWTYTIASTIVAYLLLEAAAYYTHRLFHNKRLFRRYHRFHHRLVAPTPFSTTTMHPVEFISFQATAFLPTFILPMWAGSFIALLIYVLMCNMVDHSGIDLVHRTPWLSSTRYHDDHHVHFHCNYGQSLTFFDRLHGTLRRRDRRYGAEVFGGRGTAKGAGEELDDGSGEDPYVDYYRRR